MTCLLPSHWCDLRTYIAAAGFQLTSEVFLEISKIFLEYYFKDESELANLTPEYGKDEYLLVVAENGQGNAIGLNEINLYREIAVAHSRFSKWFQVSEKIQKESNSANFSLLAARWLCHLVGLRHRTVELFIDISGIKDHTLVQVRGLQKVLAPGTFDLPCAGHVIGHDGIEDSLRKELNEELNLDLGDFTSLFLLASFASEAQEYRLEDLVNVEYCYLFRGQITPLSLKQIHFNDGEVAGVALFQVDELREMVQRFPERVARGIVDSLPFYR